MAGTGHPSPRPAHASSATLRGTPFRTRTRLVIVALVVISAAAGCALIRPDPARLARVEPRLGELLLVGFSGTTLDGNAELERLLCDARIGGVILFARNIVDSAQLETLTSAMSARARTCAGRPLLVAVDAEGGEVMRLGERAGFTPSLSARDLGEANDFAATELEAGRIGMLLRAHGITWNLAPVVDIGYNPANPVIVGQERSFGANPLLVTEHARAWIRGMHTAGVLTALKHFPGHGSSYGDTHAGFVDVTSTADPDIELVPYRALIAERLVDAVVTAHVVNRHLDAYPAALSRATVTNLLRRQLGFRGVVVSDDMRMAAIEQNYGFTDAITLALGAGVDVLLIVDDRLRDGRSASGIALTAIRQALVERRLGMKRVEDALDHVAALRARARVTR